MKSLLAQIILAARDKNFESWTNILFIVVIGIFWIVGGILKAKANKSKQQEQEQPGRKLPEAAPRRARKPLQKKTPYQQAERAVGRTQESQPWPQVQPPRRKIARPQPVGRKLPTKKEQAAWLETIEPTEALELSLSRPQLQPKREELPKFTGELGKVLKDKGLQVPSEVTRAETPVEPLLDYDDIDSLKRAILHYEILGKPLSLRGPSEHIIGL